MVTDPQKLTRSFAGAADAEDVTSSVGPINRMCPKPGNYSERKERLHRISSKAALCIS